jgi:hypothetical protein
MRGSKGWEIATLEDILILAMSVLIVLGARDIAQLASIRRSQVEQTFFDGRLISFSKHHNTFHHPSSKHNEHQHAHRQAALVLGSVDKANIM